MFDFVAKYWMGILIAAAVILAAGLGLIIFNGVYGQGEKQAQQIMDQTGAFSNAEFSLYDGKIVTGNDVRDAVSKYMYRPQFSIFIETGNNPSGFYALNLSVEPDAVLYDVPSSGNVVGNPTSGTTSGMVTLNEMRDVSDTDYYVNPSGRFRANIYFDANNEVRLIYFKQI